MKAANCSHEAYKASEESFATLDALDIWEDAGDDGCELVIGNCPHCTTTLGIQARKDGSLVRSLR